MDSDANIINFICSFKGALEQIVLRPRLVIAYPSIILVLRK